ncbi:Uncharacterized protein APZ42_014355 [Daphnia magna]|uniref:Uncharacterized protein n=1 Tax=Daphnia magna TaxID=35525 RepID=A0A162Q820_9CRUS|nr:Uncharacterized protein APZ42_014355 [Daphnia magna]
MRRRVQTDGVGATQTIGLHRVPMTDARGQNRRPTSNVRTIRFRLISQHVAITWR